MRTKERLEEIEKNLDPLGYGMGGHLINVNDIYWLVKYARKQSERVYELESDSYNAHLERLLDRKEQEIERYREALEFYADRENYKPDHYDPNTHEYMSVIDYDEGATARKALEESK